MEVLPILFSVVLVIVTIIMSVVGVQIYLVLKDLRKTITKLNAAIDGAESKFHALATPLQSLGGMASGVKAGIKVFETFTTWLNKDSSKKK